MKSEIEIENKNVAKLWNDIKAISERELLDDFAHMTHMNDPILMRLCELLVKSGYRKQEHCNKCGKQLERIDCGAYESDMLVCPEHGEKYG